MTKVTSVRRLIHQVLDNYGTKERELTAFEKFNKLIPDTKYLLITNSEEATINYKDIDIQVYLFGNDY